MPEMVRCLVWDQAVIRVNIAEAKAHLSRYLGRVERGETCLWPKYVRFPSHPESHARWGSTAG